MTSVVLHHFSLTNFSLSFFTGYMQSVWTGHILPHRFSGTFSTVLLSYLYSISLMYYTLGTYFPQTRGCLILYMSPEFYDRGFVMFENEYVINPKTCQSHPESLLTSIGPVVNPLGYTSIWHCYRTLKFLPGSFSECLNPDHTKKYRTLKLNRTAVLSDKIGSRQWE